MSVFLSHINWSPVVYGLVMFLGLWVMYWKLVNGRWLSLAIDAGVFWLVFQLHGGTMAGGFAAMICAMLAGLVFPFLLRR